MSFAVHESAVGTYRTSLVALHMSGCKIYFQFCLPVFTLTGKSGFKFVMPLKVKRD